MKLSAKALFSAAVLARLALISFSEWQDAHCQVKYTDIDYVVFTDAASFILEGDSPYKRATYRYSPLLAVLMVPNVLFRAWGKFLFSAVDILIGWFVAALRKCIPCRL